MNAPDNLYERIDAYLNGSLSEKDKLAFEADMKADASFYNEVELQKLIHQLILEKGLSDIRKQVGKDLTIKKQLPWGEINFILLSILFTGLLSYLWVDPFKEDKAENNIPNITASRNVEQIKTLQEAKTDSPKQKERDAYVSGMPAVHDTVAFVTSTSSQDQRPAHSKDTSSVVVHQASDPQQNNEKNTKKEDVTVPCPEILFSIHTEASCRNGNTGSVQLLLSGIYGGQPPYRYTIDGESSSLRTDLAAGSYTVMVKDNRGCFSQQQALVKEKNCTVFKDYSFNPTIESWKFPFTEMEHGTISIMDKSGNVVYKTDLSNGQPYEWNGRSLNGNILETGSYLYIATFTNGESRQGYIILLH